jgi:poly(A) polymerase
VARVVWKNIVVDLTGFREGTATIAADLAKRDFTVNALAVPLILKKGKNPELQVGDTLIDPCGGLQDLERKIIRSTGPGIFTSDPLRLLRAYRFMASLGFVIEKSTAQAIKQDIGLLAKVSSERIVRELDYIMSSPRAFQAVLAMSECGLLGELFPELLEGVGVEQPDSHHLDVFDHGLETLSAMEKIQKNPDRFFCGHGSALTEYLDEEKRRVWLKWAALFHDLGKPATYERQAEKDNRITFHNHDMAGASKFQGIADRLKWSREGTRTVSRLIEMHMWPFHLNNVRRQHELTPKAALRLVKAAGSELHGLFMLALADSLAGQGAGRPPDMEASMVSLYEELIGIYQKHIKPVLEKPRLLTGHDLQRVFHLQSGPVFSLILDGLQQAQVEGMIDSREDAIAWVHDYLRGEKKV